MRSMHAPSRPRRGAVTRRVRADSNARYATVARARAARMDDVELGAPPFGAAASAMVACASLACAACCLFVCVRHRGFSRELGRLQGGWRLGIGMQEGRSRVAPDSVLSAARHARAAALSRDPCEPAAAQRAELQL